MSTTTKAENDEVLALRVPNTMPDDFAEYMRSRTFPGSARVLMCNAMLEKVPPELWTVCDKATKGLDHRLYAFWEMAMMLVSATGRLPALTRAAKAENQRHIATKARALKAECRKDGFAQTADLTDLLALSVVSEQTSDSHAAAVVRTLFKLGTGNTGVKLPDLLAGIAKALEHSASQMDAIERDEESDLWAARNKQRQFEGSVQRAVERAFPRAPGTTESCSFSVADDGSLIAHKEPHGPLTADQVQSQNAGIYLSGMEYTAPLYGPFSPVHDADFPRGATKPGKNHTYVATGLIRWFRTYTGKPRRRLVSATVDALLGEQEAAGDYTAQADRNAQGIKQNFQHKNKR